MAQDLKKPNSLQANKILDEVQQNREKREKTYRERALKLFPWICGRCGREFQGKKLKELTVHHKDHDHDNNPPDGSNWELLCVYCHENEHARDQVADSYDSTSATIASEGKEAELKHQPFAGLDALLKNMQKQ